jgi:DNA-binding GntR family transcriptional regulator
MATTHRQSAYDYIKEKLIRGELSAGDRLSPAALARAIGTSHIPVREAISRLCSEGLVAQIPHRGAFVRQPDRQEVIDLMEMRKVLECNAAAWAARRITDSELDDLGSHVKRMRAVLEQIRAAEARNERLPRDSWGPIDVAFHRVLWKAAGNQQVIKVVEDTNMMVRMFGYRTDYPMDWPTMTEFYGGNYKVHCDIFAAVRRRDPRAAHRAMARHMRRARRNLLARFDWLLQQSELSGLRCIRST